jgi:hypothetical protein
MPPGCQSFLLCLPLDIRTRIYLKLFGTEDTIFNLKCDEYGWGNNVITDQAGASAEQDRDYISRSMRGAQLL